MRRMIVRPATKEDLAAIVGIEAEAILNGDAHFGYEPTPIEDAMRSFLAAEGRYPWIVAEDCESVVGFARCGAWRAREAYSWSCEVGVYVTPERQGQGIGAALYREMFPAMEKMGNRTVIAGIAQPNPASVRLHEAFGMTYAGTLPRVGWKHGRWIDVGYWVRSFGPMSQPPEPRHRPPG